MITFTVILFVHMMVIEFLGNRTEVLASISRFTVFMCMTLGTLGLQTLVYVICQTTSCIYEEIHENISVQAENLCCKTIYTWKMMLLTMQNQLREIGDWLSPNEAIYAVVKVINISTSLYTLLAVFSDPSKIKASDSNEMESINQYEELPKQNDADFLSASFLSNNTEDLTNGDSAYNTWTNVFPLLTAQMLMSASGVTVLISMLQLSLLVFYAEKISKSVSFPTLYSDTANW